MEQQELLAAISALMDEKLEKALAPVNERTAGQDGRTTGQGGGAAGYFVGRRGGAAQRREYAA